LRSAFAHFVDFATTRSAPFDFATHA